MEDVSYIIFRDGKHFFQRFIKEGFGHVSVLKRDKYNWYRIEPYNDRISFEILPFSAESEKPLEHYLGQDDVKIIKVIREVAKRKVYSISFFHFMNCVSVCKYIIGIKNRCITPYALYNWFLSSYGKQGIIEVELLTKR